MSVATGVPSDDQATAVRMEADETRRRLARRAKGPSTRRSNGLVWLFSASATLAVLVAHNSYLLTTKMYADGDFAANGILIDQSLRWRLLVGNYSRVGFHHPGPALLYVQGWSEWVLYRVLKVVPTPYNAHLIGILLLNVILLGAVAQLLYAHQRSIPVAAAGFAALSVFVASQDVVASTWMPHVYFVPFLLFTVAVGSVLAGRLASLPWLALASGLLVHGHVSFFAFVIPGAAILALTLGIRHRGTFKNIAREHWRALVGSAAIVALFALPIALNLVLHFPGEFAKYRDFAQSGKVGGHSVFSIISYHLDYWAVGPSRALVVAMLVLGAMTLALTEHRVESQRFEVSLLLSAGLMTVLFLIYGLRGIDNLNERYIGIFSLSVPAVVLVVIAMGAATRASVVRWRMAGPAVGSLAAGAALLVVAGSPRLVNPYRGETRLPQINALLAGAPDRSHRPIALTFPTETWPTSVGLMYYASHHRMRMCVSDPVWEFLVSKTFMCSEAEARNSWPLIVVPRDQSTLGRVVYADDRIAVVERPG